MDCSTIPQTITDELLGGWVHVLPIGIGHLLIVALTHLIVMMSTSVRASMMAVMHRNT